MCDRQKMFQRGKLLVCKNSQESWNRSIFPSDKGKKYHLDPLVLVGFLENLLQM